MTPQEKIKLIETERAALELKLRSLTGLELYVDLGIHSHLGGGEQCPALAEALEAMGGVHQSNGRTHWVQFGGADSTGQTTGFLPSKKVAQ